MFVSWNRPSGAFGSALQRRAVSSLPVLEESASECVRWPVCSQQQPRGAIAFPSVPLMCTAYKSHRVPREQSSATCISHHHSIYKICTYALNWRSTWRISKEKKRGKEKAYTSNKRALSSTFSIRTIKADWLLEKKNPRSQKTIHENEICLSFVSESNLGHSPV